MPSKCNTLRSLQNKVTKAKPQVFTSVKPLCILAGERLPWVPGPPQWVLELLLWAPERRPLDQEHQPSGLEHPPREDRGINEIIEVMGEGLNDASVVVGQQCTIIFILQAQVI